MAGSRPAKLAGVWHVGGPRGTLPNDDINRCKTRADGAPASGNNGRVEEHLALERACHQFSDLGIEVVLALQTDVTAVPARPLDRGEGHNLDAPMASSSAASQEYVIRVRARRQEFERDCGRPAIILRFTLLSGW